jgi:hypothetical protein
VTIKVNWSRSRVTDALADEYVNWGGLTVRRADVVRDARRRGFDDRQIDILAFCPHEVAAPADPAAEVAEMDRIFEAEQGAGRQR